MTTTGTARRDVDGWSAVLPLTPHEALAVLDSRGRDTEAGLRVTDAQPLALGAGLGWRIRFDVVDPAIETAARAAETVRVDVGDAVVLVLDGPGPQVAQPGPMREFLARDYGAVRAAMLTAIGAATGGLDQNPVAESTALVEVLAYLADSLSYGQDAVATESSLTTSRRRISATRHAALLGVAVGEGVTARVWLRFEVRCTTPFALPARTPVATGLLAAEPDRIAGRIGRDAFAREHEATSIDDAGTVFETMSAVELHPLSPPLPVIDAAGRHVGLRGGACAAEVMGRHRRLRPGVLVSFEPVHGGHGGHVVRVTEVELVPGRTVVRWASDDVVPAAVDPGAVVAHVGNLVLADHGRSVPAVGSPPVQLPADATTSLNSGTVVSLPVGRVVFAVPGDAALDEAAASRALRPVPGAPALPAVEVTVGPASDSVRIVRSLVWSEHDDLDAVVEVDDDGAARLRFGNGTLGARLAADAQVAVRVRLTEGRSGCVPPWTLVRVATDDDRVVAVTNPVAALGARAPETTASVRLSAPVRARRNDRCVTADDHRVTALGVAGVQDVEVNVDQDAAGTVVRVGVHSGWPVQLTVLDLVRSALRDQALLGVEIVVVPPQELAIRVLLAVVTDGVRPPTAVRDEVARIVRRSLAAGGAFGFGSVLYGSDVERIASSVPGVVDIAWTRLQFVSRDGIREQIDVGDPVAPRAGQIVRVTEVQVTTTGRTLMAGAGV